MDARIDALERRSAAAPDAVGLAGGLPAAKLFPRAPLATSAARVLRREGMRALQYDWPEGRPELRAWVARRLGARGARVTAEDVVITSGAQQALVVVAALLAERVGERAARIAVDAESYPGALDAFRASGAELVAMEAPADAAYVMPALQNPLGRVSSDEERAASLAHARRHDSFLVEDDAYADLAFDGAPSAPLLAADRERVFHVGTVSKTLCPGLRIGWLVPPTELRAAALEHKRVGDLQSNGLTQALLEDFLAGDDFERRVARAREHYRRGAQALARALRRELPSFRFDEAAGGFSLWVVAPEPADETVFLEHAVRHGVSFDPGSLFRAFPAGPDAPLALRLAFSVEPPRRLAEGVRRLAAAWRDSSK